MSKLNCRPGDLAFVVRTYIPQNLGRVVSVVSALGWKVAGDTFIGPDGDLKVADRTGFYWWTEGRAINRKGDVTFEGDAGHAADDQLRPIRPQSDDAQDESKSWLPPVPTREVA
jgi:hypothetical protein